MSWAEIICTLLSAILFYALIVCSELERFELIKWWASHNPYRHISDYMHRWWIIEEFGWLEGYGFARGNHADYLRTSAPKKYGRYIGWFGVRLHHIKRADRGGLHDHPWRFTTRILRGWYRELDIYGHVHLRKPGDVITRRANEFHKIIEVSPGGVWTLFTTWHRVNDWGFLVENTKVPHEEYKRERFQ